MWNDAVPRQRALGIGFDSTPFSVILSCLQMFSFYDLILRPFNSSASIGSGASRDPTIFETDSLSGSKAECVNSLKCLANRVTDFTAWSYFVAQKMLDSFFLSVFPGRSLSAISNTPSSILTNGGKKIAIKNLPTAKICIKANVDSQKQCKSQPCKISSSFPLPIMILIIHHPP